MTTERITESHRRELSVTAGSALFYGLFGLLMFAPLAFGAVEAWSIFVMEAASATLLLLWIGKQVLEGEVRIRRNPVFVVMGIFGLLIAAQLVFRISAYPHETMSRALLYICYAMLCFLASQTLLRVSQARRLALIFSLYGAVVAGFALIQGISSNGRLYWIRQPRMGGWIYGPYVNHNHYAGLMEMLAPIALVLSLTEVASAKARYMAAAAAAVMVGTIFLSESRGGMLAVAAELLILAVLLAKQKQGLRTAIGLGIFLVVGLGLLMWVGGAELSQRIASIGTSHPELPSDVRTYINRDGFRMFLKKPILGWGLGTFPVVYPQFRSFYTNFFVNEAHNDYLQLLVEMGLLGFGTAIWFLVTVYARAIKKIGNWTGEISGALTVACLLGLSGILVHSMIDFNLQIPANAALFFVMCTVAASERLTQPVRKRRVKPTEPAAEELTSQETFPQSATNF